MTRSTRNPLSPQKSSLEGWSEVIRQQGLEAAEREKLRKQMAAELLESLKSVTDLKEQMRQLFLAYESGVLLNREFFVAAHEALGMAPLE